VASPEQPNVSPDDQERLKASADRDRLKATLDGIISDVTFIRNLIPISPENSGMVAEMLGRLAHELRTAAYLLQ
jgi:hypothetical protein